VLYSKTQKIILRRDSSLFIYMDKCDEFQH